MAADARVQAHAVNNLTTVQSVADGVGVQFIKRSHTHGKVGVGKQFDGFGLGAVGKQHVDVLFDGALLQQRGKGFGALADLTHHDAAGVQVVIQGAAFAQKLGAEDDVGAWVAALRLQRRHQFGGVAHGHGAFDDHHRLGGNSHHVLHHRLDGAGVEVVGFYVVVGGGGDDDKVGASVGVCLVQRGAQVQGFVGQVVF